MTSPITFYFDFTSPHCYLAVREIQRVADKHARALDWIAVSVFDIWDAIDYHPIGKPKAKARYVRRDFERAAAVAGLPFTMPKPFPIDAVVARCAFHRIKAEAPSEAWRFARALFDHYWGRGEDISTAEQIADACSELGLDTDQIRAAEANQAAVAAVRTSTEEAIAAGAFGVPYFIVDGEPFWGQDRIAHIDWRLARMPSIS